MPVNLPLRRSPVFLLGFFPLVLLLWGWADSDRYFTHFVRCRKPNSLAEVYLHSSRVWIMLDYIDLKEAPDGLSKWEGSIDTGPSLPAPSVIYATTGPWGRWHREAFDYRDPFGGPRQPPAFRERYFPRPDYIHYPKQRRSHDPYPGRHRHVLKLPFWLLILAYLPAWLGLACWHAWRIQGRMATTDVE